MKARVLYEKQYGEGMVRKATAAGARRGIIGRLVGRHAVHRHTAAAELLQDGRVILELGCGDGEFLELMRETFDELWGVELVISRAHLCHSLLSESGHQRYGVVIANIDDGHLPWPDDYFDAIVSLSVLEHVFDVFHFIEECYRVLRLGGQLVLQVPNIAYIKYRLSIMLGRFPSTSTLREFWSDTGWDDGHLHYFDVSSLRWLLCTRGFSIESCSGSGAFAKWRKWWPSLLCGDLIVSARKPILGQVES